MKVIFKKSHLPFLKLTIKNGSGRDLWSLARTMQDENGLQHQLPAEIMLLERAAQKNDPWAMCELARTYFNYCGDMFLPMAIRYWVKAAMQKDDGATYDINNSPIIERILSYHSFDGSAYKEIEVKCALLTEMILFRSWETSWSLLSDDSRQIRIDNLLKVLCPMLELPMVEIKQIPNLMFQGNIVDGLANWDNTIFIRKELMGNKERLVELIYHELGHMIAFEILRGNNREKFKQIYGLTEERINSWQLGTMGYEVPTSEEDPDTLSYGVYTLWDSFFYDINNL